MSDIQRTQVDLPEPEDVFAPAYAMHGDHEPRDADDRDVVLSEPDAPEPPIDDEDRAPSN